MLSRFVPRSNSTPSADQSVGQYSSHEPDSRSQDQLLRPVSVDRLQIQSGRFWPQRRKDDALVVQRPNGAAVGAFGEGELRRSASGELEQPDVDVRVLAAATLHHDCPAIGRQLRRAKSLERKRAEPFLVLAGPAKPGETVLHDIRRQSPVHQHAVIGHGECAATSSRRRSADTFANRLRFAERTAEIGIERLRHQRGALIEKQVTGTGVERGRGTGEHPPGRPVVKRREIDCIRRDPVEETAAVRQELRSAAEPLAVTLGKNRSRHSARRMNLEEAVGLAAEEKDDSVAIPRPAKAARHITDDLNGTGGDVDPLEFSVGKEADRAAVRRPERPAASLGSGDDLRFEGIERSHGQKRGAVAHHLKDQPCSVGRDRW